jgi:AraC-like DNA-binding protein
LPPGVHFGRASSEIDLIISLGRLIDVLRMPNSTQRPSAFSAFVSGLQDIPAVVRQNEEVFGLHIFIKPLGVRTILGIASREISSLVVSLSDIWGNSADNLVERLAAAKTWHQRFDILDRAFLSRLQEQNPSPEIAWAWHHMEKNHGCVSIHQLADKIGWSRRHFSATFREHVGVTPKSAARVFRFERACRLIKDERPSLADVAASCGYFDQAHLTREWNTLAGCSPKTWIANELPFLQDYELGGGDDGRYEYETFPANQSRV